MQTEQPIHGRPVDRDRHQLAADAGEHAVLVRAPARERRQVLDDLGRVRVEDVRAVAVDEDPGGVGLVVRVAADVRPAIEHEDALAALARESLGHDAAGETGTDDHDVVAHRYSTEASEPVPEAGGGSSGDVDPDGTTGAVLGAADRAGPGRTALE